MVHHSPVLFSERLLQALSTIHATPPRLISAPGPPPLPNAGAKPARGKRASVAIILRIRPSLSGPSPPDLDSRVSAPSPSRAHSSSSIHGSSPTASTSASLPPSPTQTRLREFFNQPWVREGIPEILYIKRATRASDRWSNHIAFPGGRQEPGDESSLYTSLRETWEEVGIDLAERKDWIEVGQLDDREITTSLGKRLLMVLSPFVFLHTSPTKPIPDIQESEVASAHWVPLSCLLSPHVRWGDVPIDISSRLTPRHKFLRRVLSVLTGTMHFKCILLPNEPITPSSESSPSLDAPVAYLDRTPLNLWGLTLGMSLDLLSHMQLSSETEPGRTILADAAYGNGTSEQTADLLLAPSMTSIFPTFRYPDINLFIWLFGARYRSLVRRWNARLSFRKSSESEKAGSQRMFSPPRSGNPHAGRVNFAGMALNQFYAAVRKALLLTILFRATVLLGGTSAAALWLVRRLKERSRQRVASA